MKKLSLVLGTAAVCALVAFTQDSQPKEDGYRGIWYQNQPSKDQYRYKYSGGFATYPQQHVPIAIYAPQVEKTFFCLGGTVRGKQELVHLVSFFDHRTGEVPLPTLLLNKGTEDAHDNPVLQIDDEGYIWIFSNAHGTSRPAFIHRSRKPYSVDSFELIQKTNFSYSQPWHIAREGFLFLHTRYGSSGGDMYRDGRSLYWMTSTNGVDWNQPHLLARFGMGHYQVSWKHGERVGTAFNYHPPPVGLNARTNLYYLETKDRGWTWQNVAGQQVATPLTEAKNAALVHDFESEKRLVYLKDIQYYGGRPILLYLTSAGWKSGPESGPRYFETARWNGREWEIRRVAETDHNYDFGSLYVEPDGVWRFIGPTEPGPQPFGTGGEIVMWISRDDGRTWKVERQVTRNSRFNHTYVRRPLNAHPDFYAIWADGNAFEPSESSIYFTNRSGDKVWRLPVEMKRDRMKPELVRFR